MMSKILIFGIILITIVIAVVIVLYFTMKSHPSSAHPTPTPTPTPAPTPGPGLYLKSKTGMYFVCDEGKKVAVSANMAHATPLNIIKCKDTDGYCLFSKDNKVIAISGDNTVINVPSGYLLYISSISNTAYIGIVGANWLFDQTSSTFIGTAADATVWNVVTVK